MISATRKLSETFINLLKIYSSKGFSQEEMAKILNLKSPQLTNFKHVLDELIRKDGKNYLHADEKIPTIMTDEMSKYNNISIEYFFKLKTFIELLNSHQQDYKNTPLTLKKTSIENFFIELNVAEIAKIDLIGHTGENIVKGLIRFLKRNNSKHIITRILIRSKESEIGKRQNGISETIRDIRELKLLGYQIDILFYENLPAYRAIIAYPTNKPGRIAYMGSFDFMNGRFTNRSDYSYYIEEKSGRHYLIDQALSWFNHYWGNKRTSALLTHTIVLDFDDTIINSHSIQIKAWLNVIKQAKLKYQKREITLKDEFLIADDDIILEMLSTIFFREQHASRIIDFIFDSIENEKIRDEIQTFRFSERKRLMLDPQNLPVFFDGFLESFKSLSPNYNFIILSATNEQMIKDFFIKKQKQLNEKKEDLNFIDSFLYIFGKNEPGYEWRSIKHKSQILIKISKILGIPIERMVYVGDNHGDWDSSSTIGMDFVEARLFLEKEYKSMGKESLISDKSPRHYFKKWVDFHSVLKEVENRKWERSLMLE